MKIESGTIASTDGVHSISLKTAPGLGGGVTNVVRKTTFSNTVLDVGSSVNLDITGPVKFSGFARLDVSGNVSWKAGEITLTNHVTVDVKAGGTFDIQGDHKLAGAGASGVTFSAAGTVKKSTGIGTATVEGVAFTLSGGAALLTPEAGTLYFATSTTKQESGKTFLNGGTLKLDNEYLVEGGTLYGTGTIDGDLVNDGGTVHPGPLTDGGTLTVANYTE